LPCFWIQREVDLRGLAPILVTKPGSWFLDYGVSRSMPVTRSGTSYAMATNQNPNNLNPNDQNPNTQDTNQPQLQHQTDQISTVLEQLTHQLDVMDERYVREEYGPFNRRGCIAVHGEGLDESDGDAYEEEEENQEFEDHEPRVQRHRQNFHQGHAGLDARYQPLDELTKRMKVDVLDFLEN
jgi:hypothetical protein